jgi:uncharacterized protein YxeA
MEVYSMKKLMSILMLTMFCISSAFALTGCESDPVSNIIISNEKYSDETAVEEAKQPNELSKNSDIYASINFIESPKGMKYTVVWSYDGETVKTDEKEMTANQHGVIVYTLEADKVREGTLKLEIKYKDRLVTQIEAVVK